MAGLRALLLRLLLAMLLGFLVALLLPRQRWKFRPRELPSGPWPPLDDPSPTAGTGAVSAG